jgi:glycerol-3-phosphate dehydrogenase
VLRDEVSGETCEVRPRIVVNATGPWIDFTNRGLGRESRFIGGTKGSHIVLDHPELVKATGEGMIYFVNRDGRICIFYAVEDRVIAGATDIPEEDPEAVCDEAEVDYILEAMRLAFPSIRVDRSHVVFRFCGVRPLPRSDALTPGQISRDHSYPVLPPGNGIDFPIYSLVGGKWTTFRALAEQVANEILPGCRWAPDCLKSDAPPCWSAMARGRIGSPLIYRRAPMRRSPVTPVTPAGRSSSWRAASGLSTSTIWC